MLLEDELLLDDKRLLDELELLITELVVAGLLAAELVVTEPLEDDRLLEVLVTGAELLLVDELVVVAELLTTDELELEDGTLELLDRLELLRLF